MLPIVQVYIETSPGYLELPMTRINYHSPSLFEPLNFFYICSYRIKLYHFRADPYQKGGKNDTDRDVYFGSEHTFPPTVYSRTSVARTLMARLPGLFRTRSILETLKNDNIAADIILIGIISGACLYYIDNVLYSLESPR